MAKGRSLLQSLLRVLRRESPEEKAKREHLARAEEEHRAEAASRARAEREALQRELAWRRQQEEEELVEGLKETPIPPRLLSPAEEWAESGQWYTGFTSSNVRAMMYSVEDERLIVEFGKPGKPSSFYAYMPVSYPTAIGLYEAPSKGEEVWTVLRVRGRGNFYRYRIPYTLLSGPSAVLSEWMTNQELALQRSERKWMNTEKRRQEHGKKGELHKGVSKRGHTYGDRNKGTLGG